MSTQKHKWGRTRSGRSPLPAALATGSVITGLVACAGAIFGSSHLAALLAALTLPITVTLGWVLVVDRTTIRGAVARPSESVEGRWYDTATSGAFHDVLIMIGLGAACFSLIPALRPLEASWVMIGLGLFMAADVFIRYRLLVARGA